jgi:heavy metal sensor kinase
MFNSVRVRLTVWYTAILACVLILLALSTYFVLRENYTRRMDASAEEIADSFVETFAAEVKEEAGPEAMPHALAAAVEEHRLGDMIIAVLDSNGQVAASSEQGQSPESPLPDLKSRLAGLPSLHNLHLGKNMYRSYVRSFAANNGTLTLVLLQSLRQQNEFLHNLAETFALVIPLTLIIASAGGYFLARRSLVPVVAMSKQAEQISAANLRERLSVRNRNDELGQLAVSFNQLLERVDSSFTQQQRFMADASHELRTPVAILFGEADVALSKTERTPEEYRESLVILRSEAGRLKSIVDNLFTLTRADAGQYPLMLTDFYLDELVNECARNLRTLAASKSITLSCDADDEMPIRGDEVLLRRMIINILDNAIKYTPDQGEVLISCWTSKTDYYITVCDTGPGIPQEMQSRIFERFFRVDKARSRDEGSGAGLGLSISTWIAEAHGGKIELSHSGEDGSLFRIFLPQTRPSC